MDQLEVGRLVRQARKARGLRQSDLADRIGLTRTSVVNLEAGRQEFRLTTMVMIMKALGIKKWTITA